MPYLCHFFLRPDSCPHGKAVYVLIHPLGLSIKHSLAHCCGESRQCHLCVSSVSATVCHKGMLKYVITGPVYSKRIDFHF